MPGVNVEKEIFDTYHSADFVPQARVEELSRRLVAEKANTTVFHIARAKYVGAECLKCGARGDYRSYFLGQLKHPGCGFAWYMSPGKYLGHQMKLSFHAGGSLGTSASEEDQRKGGGGRSSGIIGFLIGGILRLAIGLCMVPIQAIVSLSQRPEKEAPASTK